ncbi:MAG: type 2 isopentenyl-diphosphate Delta-isomerase [Anaerolineaceae bacterium]|nr:type 2 isopentenyl-diphosphate Delta-isomerase [Anaerolineaceae bacterium]
MEEVSPTSSRKSDHIRINLEEDVRSGLTNGLERFRFIHQPLPELDLNQVDLTQTIFGKRLAAPLLISSMTGGTTEAGAINRLLAQIAQEVGIAMGLGSQRAAIEQPSLATSFQVRDVAPDILLFANLGAIQLNYGYGIRECLRAVQMIQADALILHLNPLQEALQPEGQTNFGSLLDRIKTICHELPVPVIVKEVGWGISAEAARALIMAGVAAIDVAGAGGTSWSQVEMYRSQDPHTVRIASVFRDWGIPTAESIQQVHSVAPNTPLFASGGLRNGVEVAKCIALGACAGGMAGPFLKAASQSIEEARRTVDEIIREIQIAMFACGARNLSSLQSTPLVRRDSTRE